MKRDNQQTNRINLMRFILDNKNTQSNLVEAITKKNQPSPSK